MNCPPFSPTVQAKVIYAAAQSPFFDLLRLAFFTTWPCGAVKCDYCATCFGVGAVLAHGSIWTSPARQLLFLSRAIAILVNYSESAGKVDVMRVLNRDNAA